MHSANFTALSRAVSFLLAPLLVVPVLLAVPVPVLPFSAESFEQPAPISATVARASGFAEYAAARSPTKPDPASPGASHC